MNCESIKGWNFSKLLKLHDDDIDDGLRVYIINVNSIIMKVICERLMLMCEEFGYMIRYLNRYNDIAMFLFLFLSSGYLTLRNRVCVNLDL